MPRVVRPKALVELDLALTGLDEVVERFGGPARSEICLLPSSSSRRFSSRYAISMRLRSWCRRSPASRPAMRPSCQ